MPAASLRLADLGAGWKATPSSSDDSNPRCSTYNPDQSDLVETGKYQSPNFVRTDGSFVATSTGIFRTATMAKKAYGRVATPALPGCFGELFAKGITRDVWLGATLAFNGKTWAVRSYELRGSPNGEDAGEVLFLLKEAAAS